MKFKDSKIVLPVAGGLIVVLFGFLLISQGDSAQATASPQATEQAAEQATDPVNEQKKHSELAVLQEGQSQLIPPLGIRVTAQSIDVQPCAAPGSSNAAPTQAAPPEQCGMRGATIVLLVASTPSAAQPTPPTSPQPEKQNEGTKPLQPEEPESITFSSVPGFQSGSQYNFQLVRYEDERVHVLIQPKTDADL